MTKYSIQNNNFIATASFAGGQITKIMRHFSKVCPFTKVHCMLMEAKAVDFYIIALTYDKMMANQSNALV